MSIHTNLPMPNTVIFDLDGTLVDTALDLTAALNHTLHRLKRPEIAAERVRHLVGHGARRLIERGLGEAGTYSMDDVAQGLPIFLDYYRANLCVHSKPYPGVEDALQTLKAQGIKLGICTNKPVGLSVPLVEALGLEAFFDAHLGGDSLPVRKPDPTHLLETIAFLGVRAEGSVFVGDSSVDAKTAKAAGIPFIAVSFGFADVAVESLEADGIINHFNELQDIIHLLYKKNSLQQSAR